MTQEGLARLIGVSFQTVNRWEAGSTEPGGPTEVVIQSLEKIAASGKAGELMEEFRSGTLAGGSGPAFHRIFEMAFGFPSGKAGRGPR